MSRAANPLPPPSSRAPHPRPRRAVSFRRVFLGVLLAHLLVILGIAFFRIPEKKAAGKPGEQPIAMFTPLAAASPPPAPTPTPTPPVPQPTPPTPTPPEPQPTPTPPEPTSPPTPEPAPEPVSQAPSEIVVPPKPPTPTPVKPTPTPPKPETPKVQTPPPAVPAKPATPTPTPAKPEKHVPKVNLTEVSHGATAPAKPPAHTAVGATGTGEGPALKASDVSHQLDGALTTSGATHKVDITGPPGDHGDNGNSEYYQLIQRAMYGAWDQPTDLMGRHLVARIQVHISRDGTISDCTLAGSSGNAAFDQSALAAARRAGRLSKPRPDDVPETVAINFKLAD